MGSVFGVGIILLGCVGEVMNQAQTLALERDWVATRYSRDRDTAEIRPRYGGEKVEVVWRC